MEDALPNLVTMSLCGGVLLSNKAEHKKKKKKVGGPILRVLGTLVLIAVVTGAMIACMAALYIKVVIIPDSGLNLADYALDMNLTTTMYYTNRNTGENIPMQTLHGEENRILVDFEDIPQDLKDAAVAIEDKRFYKHNGVDWIRTAKGVICMFTGQDIQGGSTLTQQLIKNITKDDQVTVKRKIQEIFRALELEDTYQKEEILGWYLNYIFFGEGCNGVYTASYAYFGKDVKDLSLAECASLIGITNNPSRYNPYSRVTVTDPDTGEVKTAKDMNKDRQKLILWNMEDQGYITQEEYDQALAEELVFVRGEDESRPQTIYSWYVDAVIDQVIDDLMETYNLSETVAANKVYSGGLEIYSCMDPNVQSIVDAVYGDRNNLPYTSPNGQPLQSAITIVDNGTGEVVALAGGMGVKDTNRGYNRATRALRPPGSAIKPLTVYGPALDMGLITPSTTEVDSPVRDGWPVNSYGSYYGKMTINKALEISANTVAVKVLEKYVTLEASYQFMKDRFHIELVKGQNVGDKFLTDIAPGPLALGGLTKGVSTYQMAAAYSVFPRGGTYYEPSTYSKVVDNDGNVLLERNTAGQVALKEKTTYYMNNMLEGVIQRGTGTRASFPGQELAGKTGTTSHRNDLWFVGYSPYYTAAVWTGYDQLEPMRSFSHNPSCDLWKQVMSRVHKYFEAGEFKKPGGDDLVTVSICSVTGLRANEYCPAVWAKIFKEDVPNSSCTTHKKPEPIPFDINNPDSWPTDPSFNPQDPATWPGYKPPDTGGNGIDGSGAGGEQTPPTPPPPEPPPDGAGTE